jgi:hypothetical protein
MRISVNLKTELRQRTCPLWYSLSSAAHLQLVHKQVCTEKLANFAHLRPRPRLEGANSHSVPGQLLFLIALGCIVLCVSFGLLKNTWVHERVIVSNQDSFNHSGELDGCIERPNLGRKSEKVNVWRWNVGEGGAGKHTRKLRCRVTETCYIRIVSSGLRVGRAPKLICALGPEMCSLIHCFRTWRDAQF